MISFLKLRESSLCGSTMEFSKIVSDGTETAQPEIEQKINYILINM